MWKCPDCGIELKSARGNHMIRHGKKTITNPWKDLPSDHPKRLEAAERLAKYNREIIGPSNIGRKFGPMSEERKNKIRQKKLDWSKNNPEEVAKNIERMAEANRGREFSEDHRQKLSGKMQARWDDPVEHEQLAEIRRNREHIFSEEGLKAISEAIKKSWRSGKLRSKSHKQNKSEHFLEDLLNLSFDNKWVFVGYDPTTHVEGKTPDFLYVSDWTKFIEFHGCWYHGCNQCHPTSPYKDDATDLKKLELFKSSGFDTLVIWEHELKRPFEVFKKVYDFVGEQFVPSEDLTKKVGELVKTFLRS